VAALKPGAPTPFALQRGDQRVEISVQPGTRPRPARQR
jgi:hypothetical protein